MPHSPMHPLMGSLPCQELEILKQLPFTLLFSPPGYVIPGLEVTHVAARGTWSILLATAGGNGTASLPAKTSN